jgi:hypothetical protein
LGVSTMWVLPKRKHKEAQREIMPCEFVSTLITTMQRHSPAYQIQRQESRWKTGGREDDEDLRQTPAYFYVKAGTSFQTATFTWHVKANISKGRRNIQNCKCHDRAPTPW